MPLCDITEDSPSRSSSSAWPTPCSIRVWQSSSGLMLSASMASTWASRAASRSVSSRAAAACSSAKCLRRESRAWLELPRIWRMMGSERRQQCDWLVFQITSVQNDKCDTQLFSDFQPVRKQLACRFFGCVSVPLCTGHTQRRARAHTHTTDRYRPQMLTHRVTMRNTLEFLSRHGKWCGRITSCRLSLSAAHRPATHDQYFALKKPDLTKNISANPKTDEASVQTGWDDDW